MDRFGGRARLTGLGSLGLLLALLVVVAGGCSGSSSAHSDPPAKARPTPATIAPVKRNLSLPGADVSKARDGGGGDLRRVHFYDRALGQADSYLIYLPQGYANQAKSGARFPVLYLLHGDGRNDRHGAGHLFQRGRVGPAATRLVRSGASRPMLIVMPETTDSSVVGDTEWANTSRGRFASGVIDLVRSVDSTWPTVRNRAGRGIAGLSMGGYGAVNIALRHLSLFSVVESWSGYFTQTPTGPFAGATPARLRANSPAAYVHTLWSQLTADPIHVLLYISRTDPLHVQQGPFAARLASLGVPVEAHEFGGPHNFALWSDHMALALSYAARWLSDGTG
jgi:enterochelin esterase-like enzyme